MQSNIIDQDTVNEHRFRAVQRHLTLIEKRLWELEQQTKGRNKDSLVLEESTKYNKIF